MGLRGCKPKSRPLCLRCGQPVKALKHRYCSRECMGAAYRTVTDCICKQCGTEFRPRANCWITFCSRECAFAYKQANAKNATILAFPVLKVGLCRLCGGVVRLPKRFCSDGCAREWWDRRRVRQAASEKPVVVCFCRECGKEFTPIYRDKRKVWCSKRCHKRAVHRDRRHIERSAHQSGQRFTALTIYERDGWRCHICGRKINQHTRCPHPMAATLDHIVPLAEGGKHMKVNVRAAHFLCNAKRQANGSGQLRLIG